MKRIAYFAVPVLICFVVGFAAGQFQADSIREWYPYLQKPELTPPNMLFPVAWGLLYLMMGISAGLIPRMQHPERPMLMRLWGVQLAVNFAWSILFFYFRSPLAGLADILLLDLLVLWYIVKSFPVSRSASLLMLPYLIWILFATYLNAYIWAYN